MDTTIEREVTRDEFYSTVGQLNVHPHHVGPWPYTAFWKTPSGMVKGKTVDFLPEGSALPSTRYFVTGR